MERGLDAGLTMLVTAMRVELVIAIKTHTTKSAFGMAFEPALINCSRIVVAEFLMFSQLGGCEKIVLMSEDLLVPSAKVAGRI